MEYLYEGLKRAIEDRGISVLTDKYLVNMMADYQVGKELPAYKGILKQIQLSGYIDEMLNYYRHAENNYILSKLQFYALSLSTDLALKINSVRYVLDCIAYSIGLVTEPIVPEILNKFKYNPLGHWEFNFTRDKSQLLVITADGIAVTECKTKYKWVVSNEDEIKFFITNIVSYDGWFIDDDNIEGNAYSFVYNRSWRWRAIRCDYTLSLKNILRGRWKIVNKQIDLPDNIVIFKETQILCSDLYSEGSWDMEDGKLMIITANGYIRYTFQWNNNRIEGIATNKAGITWNCELSKLN